MKNLLCFLCLVLSFSAFGQKKKTIPKADFTKYWAEFKTALQKQDKKKVADFCEFELYYILISDKTTQEDERVEITRRSFLKEDYERLFNAEVRKIIANTNPQDFSIDPNDADKRVLVVALKNKQNQPVKRRFFFTIEENKYYLTMVDEAK
jgi:hypothetical protein